MLTKMALKGRGRRPAWTSDARARSANKTKSCKSLPGSSDEAVLINTSRAFCNMRVAACGPIGTCSELKIQKFQPLPHSEQRDRKCDRGNQRPYRVRPPL